MTLLYYHVLQFPAAYPIFTAFQSSREGLPLISEAVGGEIIIKMVGDILHLQLHYSCKIYSLNR